MSYKSDSIPCIFCDSDGDTMHEVSYTDHIIFDGGVITMDDIVHYQCDICQSVLTKAEQFVRNTKAMQSRLLEKKNLDE